MISVEWPKWVAWAIAIAIVLNLVLTVSLWAQLSALRSAVMTRNHPVRNRAELEEAFRAGSINREQYERLKAQLS